MPRVVRCACGQDVGVDDNALGLEGNCVWCGGVLQVSTDNSKVVPALGLTTPEMELHNFPSMSESISGTVCARCGGVFKGDWDRNRTNFGVVCHRCANQWKPPEKTVPKYVPAPLVDEEPPTMNPDPLVAMRSTGLADTYDDGFQSHTKNKNHESFWKKHKEKLWYFLISAVVVIGVTFIPFSEFVAFVFGNEAVQSGERLSVGNGVIFMIVRFLTSIAIVFVPLYVGLASTQSLPNESLRHNLIAVGAVSMALSLFLFFFRFPIYRGLTLLGQFAVVSYIYDIDSRGFLKFLFIFLVLSSLMLFAAKTVEVGTYGLLVGLS